MCDEDGVPDFDELGVPVRLEVELGVDDAVALAVVADAVDDPVLAMDGEGVLDGVCEDEMLGVIVNDGVSALVPDFVDVMLGVLALLGVMLAVRDFVGVGVGVMLGVFGGLLDLLGVGILLCVGVGEMLGVFAAEFEREGVGEMLGVFAAEFELEDVMLGVWEVPPWSIAASTATHKKMARIRGILMDLYSITDKQGQIWTKER